MSQLTDYSFKPIYGGIIVNKNGETVAQVTDNGLSHKGDAAWNEFQSLATTYVANLIKGEQK